MMINHQSPYFPDAVIYDPIEQETYDGHQTYLETGTDYAVEIAIWENGGRLLYYVHKITIPKSVCLKKGHPFIIRSKSSDVQLFGVLAAFEAEPGIMVVTGAEYGSTGEPDKLHVSTNHLVYHLVFAKIDSLEFFDMVENIRKLYESKTKETSQKSRS
jgi:hypothetical protein